MEGQVEQGTAKQRPGRAGKKPGVGCPRRRMGGWLKLQGWQRGQECSLRASVQGTDGRQSSKALHGKERTGNNSLNITNGWEEPGERGKLEMQSGQGKLPRRPPPWGQRLMGVVGQSPLRLIPLSLRDLARVTVASFLWKQGGRSSEGSGCVWSRVERV